MQNNDRQQVRIKTRKTLRLDLDADIIRLAKSKAAAQEISMWWVADRLLRLWVRGDVSLNGGPKNG